MQNLEAMDLTTLISDVRLCVVGNINRDIKTAPIDPDHQLLVDGETPASAIIETIGGGGANSACAAAAFGASVTFVGRVGMDPLAERLMNALQRWGVDARLARSDAHPTGTSVGLAYTSGHRHFISALPSAYAFRFEDIDLTALDASDHLLRADIWFSEAMLFGGNERLLRTARGRGIETSIDLNWDPRWGRAAIEEVRRRKQAVRDVLPHVSLAHGNIRELNEFADASALQTTLERLEEWGAQAVVVHMGAEGAGYYTGGEFIVQPPAPIARQVNNAGTGDVLSVCMMLLHKQTNLPISERLRISNCVVAEFIEGSRRLLPEIE